ncbi:hypothetical protein CNR22_01470 [Sphingobacteriaceae bacterium]|nr:hypothetical protein CNR22_01470 [Sphingobacteriaceae bacterium]
MKWRNTRLDKLPKDKQEVLLSKDGINYVAVYTEKGKFFSFDEKGKEKIIRSNEEQLYWTEYSRPGAKK